MTAPETGPLRTPEITPPALVLLVAAPFYRDLADGLLSGARSELDAAGVAHETVEVPGALEVAPAIGLAARSGRFDGFVGLGCVIRGETAHYEIVCGESARGITLLGVQRGLAIGNGVLTCETMEQAEARADPDGMNKGGGAAAAALHLIALTRRYPPPSRGSGLGSGSGPGDTDTLLAGAAGLTRLG